MESIFSELAQALGWQFTHCSQTRPMRQEPAPGIFFDWHSKFEGLPIDLLPIPRGIHLIRDPRMVVVSAALYHLRSTEAWLHIPLDRFAGQTYQEKIQSFQSNKERFIFEMREGTFTESAGHAIRDMQRWCNQQYKWCRDIKLEDLMQDYQFRNYRQLFEFIGVPPEHVSTAENIAYRHSVFNTSFCSNHARTKAVEHWQTYYDDEMIETFQSLFRGQLRIWDTLGIDISTVSHGSP